MFTSNDLAQISAHNLEEQIVKTQLNNFKTGFPFLAINRAAVVGDGIMACDKDYIKAQEARYFEATNSKKLLKFVPASGAATRMFKALFEYLESNKTSSSVEKVIANAEKFAFYPQIKDCASDARKLIEAIITPSGLNYGNMPKGVIKFHSYPQGARTAAEEHLVEGAEYARSGEDVFIHFTISPEHSSLFADLFAAAIEDYQKQLGVKFNISFSTQKDSTDMIAVGLDNEPFREDDGSLLFRPAGHGALLSNLDDIDADLIFIKTVDNVLPDKIKADTISYKKVLAMLALDAQSKIFELIKRIDKGEDVKDEALKFINQELNYFFADGAEPNIDQIKAVLNRPLRVCGMVKNQGEPGGGPFWAKNSDGSVSLQIAESSQISPEQISLMREATHFNPVDLVCAVKDYQGNKFNLMNYLDSKTGFISEKSKSGRALKAQELPGLWNGAMSNWNTLFVEVPITTFSPVKELSDLLREEHQ